MREHTLLADAIAVVPLDFDIVHHLHTAYLHTFHFTHPTLDQ